MTEGEGLIGLLREWGDLEPTRCEVAPTNVRVKVDGKFQYVWPFKLQVKVPDPVQVNTLTLLLSIEEAIYDRGWAYTLERRESFISDAHTRIYAAVKTPPNTAYPEGAKTSQSYHLPDLELATGPINILDITFARLLLACYLRVLRTDRRET